MVIEAPAARVVVGVADMKVSDQPQGELITFALGSCIGLTAYDSERKIGGLLHFMLPSAPGPAEDAAEPFMYGQQGVERLLASMVAKGADRDRLQFCAAGAAQVLGGHGVFEIGKRNRTMLRKVLWRENLRLRGEDTGGQCARTLTLDLDSGRVKVRTGPEERILWCP